MIPYVALLAAVLLFALASLALFVYVAWTYPAVFAAGAIAIWLARKL